MYAKKEHPQVRCVNVLYMQHQLNYVILQNTENVNKKQILKLGIQSAQQVQVPKFNPQHRKTKNGKEAKKKILKPFSP